MSQAPNSQDALVFGPQDTVLAALERAAQAYPDRIISVFDGRGQNSESRLCKDMLGHARVMARKYAAWGVKPGDRVIICLINNWDWFDAWVGAIALGALPVAVSPGVSLGASAYLRDKIKDVADMLDARLVICGAHLVDLLMEPQAGTESKGTQAITFAQLSAANCKEGDLPFHASQASDTAFLQLTSGSTGRSRAVEISNAALLHNIQATQRAINSAPGAKSVSIASYWLPLFHDFGLVMSLGAILSGVNLRLYQPRTFLARPAVWLGDLGGDENAISATPNFGLQHCSARVDDADLEGLDLASCQTVVVAAEMVQPQAVRSFTDRFGAFGLSPQAVKPAYGLAEATLIVTMDTKGEGLRTARVPTTPQSKELVETVCCGAPLKDTLVRVVGPDGTELHDGQVGAIQVNGPGVFSRYFKDAETSAAAFRDGYLITGDLGCMIDGELYVTGRTKDILIVRGENHMPHDLERLAEAETGGGNARAGAFSVLVSDQVEQSCLVVELMRDQHGRAPEIDRLLRRKIAAELGLTIDNLIFVPTGTIPRTTSGKIRRDPLRKAFLEGHLEQVRISVQTQVGRR